MTGCGDDPRPCPAQAAHLLLVLGQLHLAVQLPLQGLHGELQGLALLGGEVDCAENPVLGGPATGARVPLLGGAGAALARAARPDLGLRLWSPGADGSTLT